MSEENGSTEIAEEVHPLDPSQQQEPPEAEQVEQEADEQEPEEPKETKTYTQEELDRIVKKVKRNTSYLTRKEAEAELYRKMAERGPQRQQADQPTEEKRPERDEFDDYETYLRADARFEARQEFKALQSQQQRQTQQSAYQSTEAQRLARYESDVAKARDSLDDFDEVTSSTDVPITQTMRDAILESDVGALLTYHLAKNPTEAARIARLSPVAQAKAIGVIESTIATKPAPKQSKAPAPIRPISGGSGGQADPSKMSMDDYAAWRAKQSWARR